MQERTYLAERFDLALAKAKRDLGPDAVILSSRRVTGYAGKHMVELRALPEGLASATGRLPQSEAVSRRAEPIEEQLRRCGVPPVPAHNLALHIARLRKTSPDGLPDAFDVLSDAIGALVSFAGPLDNAGARAIAFVGPTGVGKTTTIAKLAARAALIERRKVALVSIDGYRVGGTEQLERYAELIGIPMATANDSRSLGQALTHFANADLVLIDTAGRTPRDRAALCDMAETLHDAGERIDVHLCLEAAMRDAEAEIVCDRMQLLGPSRLHITKLDEAAMHGSLVAHHITAGMPLGYFTTGQRVPEDIEIASAARIAALLCEREVN